MERLVAKGQGVNFSVNYNLLSLSLLVQVIIEKESSVYVADGKVCKYTT